MKHRVISVALVPCWVLLGTCAAAADAEIESFSPTGFTKDVRQVAVRFSAPMVALGDPDRRDPFTVKCATPGTGRWIDERHWVFDFEHEVPGAEQCTFALRRGLRTLAGKAIAGPRERSFHTGGPTIIASRVSQRRSAPIDERQVFLLALDARADEQSIERHARCRVAGRTGSIAVDLVADAKRTEILDALRDNELDFIDELVESVSTHLPRQDGIDIRERAMQRIVMVRCRTPLPNGTPVELVWGAGVAGVNGVASPKDQVLEFTVRPAFRAHVGCSATWQGQCLGAITVSFTAPLTLQSMARVRLLDAEGVELPAETGPQRIDFDAGILEESSYRVELDGPIADIAPQHADMSAAKSILRTRLNLQGTSLGFSTEQRDRLWSLMVSVDSNAARTVASLVADPDWGADMPRLMRGLLGRQQRGRWRTTVANAWGAIATARFAAAFEATPVSGTSVVRLGGSEHRLGWRDDESPAPVEIPWAAATLTLDHEGAGAPWGLVEFRAAVPRHRPVARGYRIARDVRAVYRQGGRGWRRGDVAGVVLDIDADRDMTWVVVEDPLPPGAVVLGSGLGGDSDTLRGGPEYGDGWPVYTERDLDSYRAYYRYVPKGRLSLRYNVRYNTAGAFTLPPTRIEAMYAPEMHAERPVKPITIR